MKKIFTLILICFLLTVSSIFRLKAQDEAADETTSPWSVGADVVSSYVWRGTYFAGASFQPSLAFSAGNFTIGTWGSFDFNGDFGEADLFASYSFDFGLSLGLTDYYYPGAAYFDFYDEDKGSHALELNAGYEIGGLSLSGNYIFNEAPNKCICWCR